MPKTVFNSLIHSQNALAQARSLAESDLALYTRLKGWLARPHLKVRLGATTAPPGASPALSPSLTIQLSIPIREGSIFSRSKLVDFSIPVPGANPNEPGKQLLERVKQRVDKEVARLEAVTPALVDAQSLAQTMFLWMNKPESESFPHRKELISMTYGLLATTLRHSGAADLEPTKVDTSELKRVVTLLSNPNEVKLTKVSQNGTEEVWEITNGRLTARARYRPEFLQPWKLLP